MTTNCRPVTAQPETLTAKIIDAVADAKGVDPVDLNARLHDVVDTDALNAIFEHSSAERQTIEFTFDGYDVLVQRGGSDVSVQPTEPIAPASPTALADD